MSMSLPKERLILIAISIFLIFSLCGCSNGLEQTFNEADEIDWNAQKGANVLGNEDFGFLYTDDQWNLKESNEDYLLYEKDNDYIILTNISKIKYEKIENQKDITEIIEGLDGLQQEVKDLINYFYNKYYLVEKLTVNGNNGFIISNTENKYEDFYSEFLKNKGINIKNIDIVITVDGKIVGYNGDNESEFFYMLKSSEIESDKDG